MIDTCKNLNTFLHFSCDLNNHVPSFEIIHVLAHQNNHSHYKSVIEFNHIQFEFFINISDAIASKGQVESIIIPQKHPSLFHKKPVFNELK